MRCWCSLACLKQQGVLSSAGNTQQWRKGNFDNGEIYKVSPGDGGNLTVSAIVGVPLYAIVACFPPNLINLATLDK